MSSNQKHHCSASTLTGSFLGVVLVAGLLLFTIGCGGTGSQTLVGSANPTPLSDPPPPSTPTEIRIGSIPPDRIVSFELQVNRMVLKGVHVGDMDVLPNPSNLELTRVGATTEIIALPYVVQDSYSQLEMIITGAHVTYLDSTGSAREKNISSNFTSVFPFDPPLVIDANPNELSVVVDIPRTVELIPASDPADDVVNLNPPVITVTHDGVITPPASVQGSNAQVVASAAQKGRVERAVGNVTGVWTDNGVTYFALNLGQTGATLNFQYDVFTVFENVTPDTLDGMLVEVEGGTLSSGTLFAEMVEALFPATGVEVEGTLSGRNASGNLHLVPQDGIGAGMTTALVGAKVSSDMSGASYAYHAGDIDMTGLTVVFDASHVFLGQRVEAESLTGLQPDQEGNAARIASYKVELLQQTLNGVVTNYQEGAIPGTASFDLALPADSYLSIMNPATTVAYVNQVSTTWLDGFSSGIQDGQSVTVRGLLFCDDSNDVPPGTPLHFVMVASSITKQ